MIKKFRALGFSLVGFLLFFLTIAVTSTFSIFVYYLATTQTNGNTVAVVFSVLGVIIFGALVCMIFDIVRRKTMIEQPVNKILDATKKIAAGDFSVKLEHVHDYSKFDEYDMIFDNINAMTAELSKNEILKNDFISSVSHEIKTPLAVIQNYAALLQNAKISEERKNEYLQVLVMQSKKLSDLISNILKLNKLENQKIVPEMTKFDLAELLRVCILQFEPLIEKKNLKLMCDIDDLTVSNSSTLLEIVFNNLISNAIKFTNKGGKIAISLKKDKNFAVIKVKDTGCGISNEVGQHIFDKFYQGDTSRSGEGNGLGLALVKRVIDLVGGEISVESKVGKGTTFTLKFKKDNV